MKIDKQYKNNQVKNKLIFSQYDLFFSYKNKNILTIVIIHHSIYFVFVHIEFYEWLSRINTKVNEIRPQIYPHWNIIYRKCTVEFKLLVSRWAIKINNSYKIFWYLQNILIYIIRLLMTFYTLFISVFNWLLWT